MIRQGNQIQIFQKKIQKFNFKITLIKIQHLVLNKKNLHKQINNLKLYKIMIKMNKILAKLTIQKRLYNKFT